MATRDTQKLLGNFFFYCQKFSFSFNRIKDTYKDCKQNSEILILSICMAFLLVLFQFWPMLETLLHQNVDAKEVSQKIS